MNKIIKRLTVGLLAVSLSFSVVSCGNITETESISEEKSSSEFIATPVLNPEYVVNPEDFLIKYDFVAVSNMDDTEEVADDITEEIVDDNMRISNIEGIQSNEPERQDVSDLKTKENVGEGEDVLLAESQEETPVPSVTTITYTCTDMDKTLYATIKLNVRSGPSTDFDVIGTYAYNESITVTGQCNETGWYRVDYNGIEGYCDFNYTSDSKQEEQTQQTTTTTNDNNTNTDTNTTTTTTTTNNNTVNTYSVVSAGDNGVSSYYVGLVQSAFNSLPQWVQSSFANNGWQIKVRSGSWWGKFGWNMQLKGLTVSDYKTIYISGRDDSADYHTVAHEVGHFVDWLYGWTSNTSTFSGIYNAEYRQFCNYYSYSNGAPGVEELFAEGLYHYWTDPGTLASVAPQTYNYINGIFG